MNKTALVDDEFAELDNVMERDYADPYFNQYDSIVARSLLSQHERARGERRKTEKTGRFGEGGIEVIVKNLPRSLNENGIRTLCEKAGCVVDVLVIPKPTHKLARVVFAEVHEAHRAVELLNGYRIGKTIVSALIKLEQGENADSSARPHTQSGQITSAPNDNEQVKPSLIEDATGSLGSTKKDTDSASRQGEFTSTALAAPAKQLDLDSNARSTTSASLSLRESENYTARPSNNVREDTATTLTSTSTSYVRKMEHCDRPDATKKQIQNDNTTTTTNGIGSSSANMRDYDRSESDLMEQMRIPSSSRRVDGSSWTSRSAQYRDAQSHKENGHHEPYNARHRDLKSPYSASQFEFQHPYHRRNPYYYHDDYAPQHAFDYDYESGFRACRPSGYTYRGSANYANDHGVRMYRPPNFYRHDYGDDVPRTAPFCNLQCPSCMELLRQFEYKRHAHFHSSMYPSDFGSMWPEPSEYTSDYPQAYNTSRRPGNGQYRYEPQEVNELFDNYYDKNLASDLSRRRRFEEQTMVEPDIPSHYNSKSKFDLTDSSRSFQQEGFRQVDAGSNESANDQLSASFAEPRPTEFGVSCNQIEEDKDTIADDECVASVPFAPSRLHRVGDGNSGPKARPLEMRTRPPIRARREKNCDSPNSENTTESPEPCSGDYLNGMDLKVPTAGKRQEDAASKRNCFLRDYPLQQVCAVRLVRFESPSEFYVLAEDETRRQWLRYIIHTLNKHCAALLRRLSNGIPSESTEDVDSQDRHASTQTSAKDVELEYRNAVGMQSFTLQTTKCSTAEFYELGNRVVVRSGNLLYRAVVDEVKKLAANTADDGQVNGSSPAQLAYRVALIDFGQSIECNAADMCVLSHAKLWSIPKLAIRCCVHNCWPGRLHDKQNKNDATNRPTEETKAIWNSTQIKEALHVLGKHISKRTNGGSERFLIDLKRVDANGVHVVDVRSLHKVSFADLLIAHGVAHRIEFC